MPNYNAAGKGLSAAMPFEQSILLLNEESVLAECGPMRLVIRAWQDDKPQIDLMRRAAAESFGYLERISRYRSVLSRPFWDIEARPQDDLASQMLKSVERVADRDLTPMAAVAGTIADAVADWLFEKGLTKVIVDNGGDIAVRIAEGQTVTVGIRPQVSSGHVSHVIHLDTGCPTWGVTTSGLGGRSLTRGIASAVTVLASSASVADAAATAIANACFVQDSGIVQVPAESIDPTSDLKGTYVTAEVGPMGPGQIRSAISAASQKAERIAQKGIIAGAFIALADVNSITEGLKKYIRPLEVKSS